MKILKLLAIVIMTMFLVLGCSGDDDKEVDNTPPTKPLLIPHLGDAGDGTIIFDGDSIVLDDFNNGIDAESAIDGIRVTWKPLIYDNDLELVRIFRYMDDHIEDYTKIDSVTAEVSLYNDIDIDADFLLEHKFSYFLEVQDKSGNKTLSDTVHYRLKSKAVLLQPQNGDSFDTFLGERFGWRYTETVDIFRVLLFSEDGTLLWIKDLDVDIQDQITYCDYTGGVLPVGFYLWRVDVLKYDSQMDIFYGSESMLYGFSIEPEPDKLY